MYLMTRPVRPHPVLTQYYATDDDRLAYLRALFNETARYYDRVNWLFSFGTGARYRRRALRRAGLQRGMRLLDIAVGTGLVASAAYRIAGGSVEIIGLDPSERMLGQARCKLPIALIQGRAEALPLADASVDFVSMGYALRHVSDLTITFAEFRRVLRPGGRLLLLEISRPSGPISRALAATYLARVVPYLSRWLKPGSELPALMQYHWDTIRHGLAADVILAQLSACGFTDVAYDTELNLFGAYRAIRPMCCQSDEKYCSHLYSAIEEQVPNQFAAR